MDWLGTYIDSNARIDYSDFASADAVWLQDISLIVPVAVLVTVFVAWVTHRSEVAAQRALVLSLTSIAFMLVFSPIMGGIPLEAPLYQSMLWPPALISLVLITTLALPDRRWTRAQTGAGVLAVAVVIATGHVASACPSGWAGSSPPPRSPCSCSPPTRGRSGRSPASPCSWPPRSCCRTRAATSACTT